MRFVGNRSSGRMGFALAEEAAALGAEVTVIAANVAPRARRRACATSTSSTAAELQDACEAQFAARRRAAHGRRRGRLPARRRRPTPSSRRTSARNSSSRSSVLPDILSGLAAIRRADQTVVGFAAEHGDGALAYGRDKLARKGLDAVVVNDIARADIGFEGSDNEVTIVTAAGERHVPRASKAEVARAILEAVDEPAQRGEGRRREHGEHRGGARPGRRGRDRQRAAARAPGGAGDHRRGRGAPRPARPGAGLRGGRGSHPHRGSPGRGQDDARALGRARLRPAVRARAVHRGPAAGRRGRAPTSSTSARTASSSARARSSPTSCIVDEINRASPKTQSGLLECMQERRVTVDVHTHELARPFVVLATQNPIEFEGTYPLPEAQVDRFMARVSMGYPSSAGEVAMLRAHEVSDRVDVLEPVATAAELLAVQDAARRVHASDALRGYVVVAAAPHARGPARRARRQPARRAAAAARRQGARPAAGPRPRPARRRAGAGRGRARPPHRARARGGGRHRRADRRRRAGGDAGAVGARHAPGRRHRASRAPADADRGDLRRRAALRRRHRPHGARRRLAALWVVLAARGVRVDAHGGRAAHDRGAAGRHRPRRLRRAAAAAQRRTSRTTCCPRRRRWSAGAGAPRCTSARASRGAGARCCRRRGSSSATRWASPPGW